MTRLDFRIPWPPTVNLYWRRVGRRTIVSAQGRAYKALVKGLVRVAAPMEGPVRVRLDCWPPDNRRRDADNILKAALDALTAAGLWLDDYQVCDIRVVRWPMPSLRADRGTVDVSVRELGED